MLSNSQTLRGNRTEINQTEQALKNLSGAFNLLKGVLLGYAGKTLYNALIGSNAEHEHALASFETLLGSADKAQKMIGELNKLAMNSPLTGAGVTNAANTMLAFGAPDTKILDYLKTLGDVTGGNEERFKSMTLAFSQMTAAGKLTGQDLLQMVNAGFNPLQIMAEKTGKTLSELKNEMSAGAISSEMVTQAFIDATSEGGRFSGMLEKQGATFAGVTNTIKGMVAELARQTGAEGARAPKLLSGGEHPAKSLILRLAKKETEKILVESKDFAKIAEDLELAPFGGVLEEYAGGAPLFSLCGADKALEEALRRKVWLPSGGFLLIEQGEACAFIDVNSGKAGGRSSSKVNIEAARETARQARLRNLSGRIAVDFITPESAAEANELREAFAEALLLDDERATIDIADKWGVYLLTRPKRGAALRDALTKPCPCCGGGGRTREGRVKEPRS